MKSLDQYGDTLTVKELAEYRGVGIKRIYQLYREGAFDHVLVRPVVGKIEFSKKKLQAWVDGERPTLPASWRKAS